jgi:hypothetical protein
MGTGCGVETWDALLALDECSSMGEGETPPDAGEGEPWLEADWLRSCLTATPCTHDLGLEVPALTPCKGRKLGRRLQWRSLDTTWMQYTAAVQVKLGV